MDIKVELDDRDNRLLEIYSGLVPFVEFSTDGMSWFVKTPDSDISFDSYESLIKTIERDIKEALLGYAICGELCDIISI